MLLLVMVLLIKLSGDLVTETLRFGEHLIQASKHFLEALWRERLALPVVRHP